MSLLSSYSFPSATSSPFCLYRDVILAISPSVLTHAYVYPGCQNTHLNVELPHLSFPFLDMRFIFENRKGVKWGAEADINGVVTFAPILRQYSLF